MLYEAACNLLELEVSRHIGRHEDVGQLAVSHKQLRHQVDVPVIEAAVLLPWLFSFFVVAIFLVQLADGLAEVIRSECSVYHTASILTDAASLV